MKAVLLTRLSPFQIYCANKLFDKGFLKALVFEYGSSIAPERMNKKVSFFNCFKLFSRIASNPLKSIYQVQRVIYHNRFYGCCDYHNKRILEDNFDSINSNLPSIRFNDINRIQSINWIKNHRPDLVFVFGTRLIKQDIIDSIGVPFVNMHWGWSPNYRGEGIVSALARGGSRDLGVTVHLIDSGIDSGSILYRERVLIDKQDNFYSIGVKLAKIGLQLFVRVFEEFQDKGVVSGTKQDLSSGKLYPGKYMKEHPEIYIRAWKRLKKEQIAL